MAGVHRAVRRQYRGLRHAGRWRRASTTDLDTATLGRDEVSDRMGPNNIVMGWKHDSKHIVFRSRMQSFNDFLGQLYHVSIDGGLPEELPLPRGGFCSFSPDDSKLVYNRVFREFRTWKRYRGGMADDLWIYDFATKKTEQLFQTARSGNHPDVERRHDLFFRRPRRTEADESVLARSQDESGQAAHGLPATSTSSFRLWATKPSFSRMAAGSIDSTWPRGATKIDVQINDDHVAGRGGLRDVSKNVTSFGVSPDGKRALFGARGEIFTVPAKDGPTRNLTHTSGVHERDADWSPDGKWISFISDASGEDEIYRFHRTARARRSSVTTGGDCYKFAPVWSPDSKKLMWADRKQRLLTSISPSKQIKEIAKSPILEFRQYVWSPDSKWIAYARRKKSACRGLSALASKGRDAPPSPMVSSPPASPASAATANICSSSRTATSTPSSGKRSSTTSISIWPAFIS